MLHCEPLRFIPSFHFIPDKKSNEREKEKKFSEVVDVGDYKNTSGRPSAVWLTAL